MRIQTCDCDCLNLSSVMSVYCNIDLTCNEWFNLFNMI